MELFRGLIRAQYKNKALASGPPANEAEFDALIDECRDQLGIELGKHEFVKNPPLRALAKIRF